MCPSSPGASGSTPDERFLDDAFAEFLEACELGRSADLGAACRRRPHLRAKLTDLHAAAARLAAGQVRPARRLRVPGYEIVRELGRGGMGRVYLARQEVLGGRQVALKILPPQSLDSESSRRRFSNEVAALGRLGHPHVVTAFEAVLQDDVHALAMEYVKGTSLAQVIADIHQSDTDPGGSAAGAGANVQERLLFTCRVGETMADALSAVHAAGLLHRDVKPSNILIRTDGTPLLSDFGLARAAGDVALTRTGEFVGTRGYAAPELLRGARDEVDERTDVFGLGATIYHVLSGRLPFGDERAFASEGREVLQEAAPLRRYAPWVPAALETIVGKAIRVEREGRYASAEDLRDDFRRFSAGEPIRARPPSRRSRVVRWLRNHRTALRAALAGSLVVALVFGARELRAAKAARALVTASELHRRALETLVEAVDANAVSRLAQPGTLPVDAEHAPKPVPPEQLERAERFLREARELAPEDAELVSRYATVAAARAVLEGSPLPDDVAGLLFRELPGTYARATKGGEAEEEEPRDLDDRRCSGLLAFLLGDPDAALDSWKEFAAREVVGDPVIAAFLGLLHLGRDEPGMAFSPLKEVRAFLPNSAVYMALTADAAARIGHAPLASRLVEEARSKGLVDPWETILRVEADLWRADGDAERALRRYEELAARHRGANVHQRLAETYDELGHEWKAICAWAHLVHYSRGVQSYVDALLALSQSWWEQLEPEERLRLVRNVLGGASRGPTSLSHLLETLELILRESSSADRLHPSPVDEGGVDLLTLAKRMELSMTSTTNLRWLPHAWRDRLARSFLSPAGRWYRPAVRVFNVVGLALAASAASPTAYAQQTGTYDPSSGRLPQEDGWEYILFNGSAPDPHVSGGELVIGPTTNGVYSYFEAWIPDPDFENGFYLEADVTVVSGTDTIGSPCPRAGFTLSLGGDTEWTNLFIADDGVAVRTDSCETTGLIPATSWDPFSKNTYRLAMQGTNVIASVNGEIVATTPDYIGQDLPVENGHVAFGDITNQCRGEYRIARVEYCPSEGISASTGIINQEFWIPISNGGTNHIHLDAGAENAGLPYWLVVWPEVTRPMGAFPLMHRAFLPLLIERGRLDARGYDKVDLVIPPGAYGLPPSILNQAFVVWDNRRSAYGSGTVQLELR